MYWDHIGIMENEMETAIWGSGFSYMSYNLTPWDMPLVKKMVESFVDTCYTSLRCKCLNRGIPSPL